MRYTIFSTFIFSMIFSCQLSANAVQGDKIFTTSEITDHIGPPNHKLFNEILTVYVSNDGIVDYSGIKSDVAKLDNYISELQGHAPTSDWSNDETLAYWINVYNAFTIKLITDNYPLNSITDLYSGKPWDHKWIEIGGKTLSLNQVENEIIRPTFNEPRIHFAVNCAAKSCPPLANEAFTADNLNSLLEKRTKAFVNDSLYNDLSTSPAQLSKIFDWYGVDFGNVDAFINKYKKDSVSSVSSHGFTDYNWELNGK